MHKEKQVAELVDAVLSSVLLLDPSYIRNMLWYGSGVPEPYW
jgi:hypothetical protein